MFDIILFFIFYFALSYCACQPVSLPNNDDNLSLSLLMFENCQEKYWLDDLDPLT